MMSSSNLMFMAMMLMFHISMTHGQTSYTCTCQCPYGTYQLSTTSPICSGQGCASACLSSYSNSGCTSSNTYGCCTSTGACANYYSSSTGSGTCNCLCSAGYGYGTVSVGTLTVGAGSCTSSYCQSYCSSVYSSTCGTYLNYAYCISNTNSTSSYSNSGVQISKPYPLLLLVVTSILVLKTVG